MLASGLPTISLRTGAGTCYYRCVLSAMKYLLKRRGVPKAAIKQLTFVIRQKYVEVRTSRVCCTIPGVCTPDARRKTQVCLRVCTCADLRLAAEDLLLHKFTSLHAPVASPA